MALHCLKQTDSILFQLKTSKEWPVADPSLFLEQAH